MTKQNTDAQFLFDQDSRTYYCIGTWSISKLDNIFEKFKETDIPEGKQFKINGSKLTQFDSAGALILMYCMNYLVGREKELELIHFNKEQQSLLDLFESKKEILDYQTPSLKQDHFLHKIGVETISKLDQIDGFIILLGELCSKFFEAFAQLRRFRLPSIASIIHSAGIQALPILALLSFLIGVVLAYQMGLQLQTYGANNFIAYLSGMAIFREFSPLITAIIVAGRTSSSFTAQIGSMKINEEIDALYTMGLSPIELLVMPKVIGLLIFFPLLIFWSDVFSIMGAMIMSKLMLSIGYHDFLFRLKEDVGLEQLMLGLYKAPAFALIVSVVGCFQGFMVKANAESIGSQTTRSVVQALFLIIIADASYSIIYSWMGI